MPRKKCNCKGLADQYMILVTIYAAIINEEFDNADDLEVLAEFLVALGEQLALAASVRGRCEEGNKGIDFEVDVNSRHFSDSTYIKNTSTNKKRKHYKTRK